MASPQQWHLASTATPSSGSSSHSLATVAASRPLPFAGSTLHTTAFQGTDLSPLQTFLLCRADDGIRLYVDHELVVDAWENASVTNGGQRVDQRHDAAAQRCLFK